MFKGTRASFIDETEDSGEGVNYCEIDVETKRKTNAANATKKQENTKLAESSRSKTSKIKGKSKSRSKTKAKTAKAIATAKKNSHPFPTVLLLFRYSFKKPGPGFKAPGLQDQKDHDRRSRGPQDQGDRGPHDQRMTGPEDHTTGGPQSLNFCFQGLYFFSGNVKNYLVCATRPLCWGVLWCRSSEPWSHEGRPSPFHFCAVEGHFTCQICRKSFPLEVRTGKGSSSPVCQKKVLCLEMRSHVNRLKTLES